MSPFSAKYYPVRGLSFLALALFVLTTGAAAGANEARGKAAATPAQPAGAPPRVVMFKMNDDEYTVHDYMAFLQSNPGIMRTSISSDAGKVDSVREMAAIALLKGAMFQEKLLENKPDLSRAEITRAYEDLAKRHFPIPPAPDDVKGHQYYLEHPDQYGIPSAVRLNEILFKFAPQADDRVKAQVKAKAEAALARLDGGEPFPKVAGELTENPVGKVTQGDIGYESPDTTPWMKQAIKDKKVGERTGLVESPAGYVILQVTEIKPALVSPYADVRNKVIKDMMDKEQKKLRDAYVNELAKDVKVEIIEPTLKPLIKGGLFPYPAE